MRPEEQMSAYIYSSSYQISQSLTEHRLREKDTAVNSVFPLRFAQTAAA